MLKIVLRWIAVLPAAVVGLFVGKMFAHLCVNGAIGSVIDPVPDGALQIGRAFFSPLGFALGGTFVAPSGRGVVGSSLAAGWGLFYLAFMVQAFSHPERFEPVEGISAWLFLAAVTVATLGGVVAAIFTAQGLSEAEASDGSRAPSVPPAD